MERFKGLAILATNRRKDLDEAFLRRLRYIVEFPLPDVAAAAAIWERVIPPGVDAARSRPRVPRATVPAGRRPHPLDRLQRVPAERSPAAARQRGAVDGAGGHRGEARVREARPRRSVRSSSGPTRRPSRRCAMSAADADPDRPARGAAARRARRDDRPPVAAAWAGRWPAPCAQPRRLDSAARRDAPISAALTAPRGATAADVRGRRGSGASAAPARRKRR